MGNQIEMKNIISYVKFNYTKLNWGYILKRLSIVWVVSLFIYFLIFKLRPYLVIFVLITNSIITIFSIILVKEVKAPQNKFIFDGVTHTCISILFLFCSYYFLVGGNIKGYISLMLLCFVMCINISLMFLLVRRNIRLNKYDKGDEAKKINVFPFLGGAIGLLAVRLFLSELDQSLISIIISSFAFFLAIIFNIGTLEFLKLYYYKGIKDSVNLE